VAAHPSQHASTGPRRSTRAPTAPSTSISTATTTVAFTAHPTASTRKTPSRKHSPASTSPASPPSGLASNSLPGAPDKTYQVPAPGLLRLWTTNAASRNAASPPAGHYLAPGEYAASAFFPVGVSNATWYAEGIRQGVVTGLITVALKPSAVAGWIEDKVFCSVVHGDIDVDSDNNNATFYPDKNGYEDRIEAATTLDGRPYYGKLLCVNDGDLDKDGTVDYMDWHITNAAKLDYPACPPGATPSASHSMRLWTLNASDARTASPFPAGHYLAPRVYTGTELLALGFSTASTVHFGIEGIFPATNQTISTSVDPDGSAGPASFVHTDQVNMTIIRPDLDINRKNGTLVPEDKEHSNGSIVQLVPQDNPSPLYPSGLFLDIPTMAVEPASVASSLTLKLKKVGPSTSVGKIRVYKNGSLFMDEDEAEKPLTSSDLSATWKLDSTVGGVVDLALIVEQPAGTELCRDTIRISSIPCEPGDGAIIFVNLAATAHTSPYDDFEETADEKIEDALTAVSAGAGDNIVVARRISGTYDEYDLSVSKDVVLAGAAGKWTVDDPADATSPTHPNPYATVFDFATLPTVKGAKGQATPAATFDITADNVIIGGLHLTLGEDPDYGGAVVGANLDGLQICYCKFDDNTAPLGGAIDLVDAQNAKISVCLFDGNTAEFHDSGTPTQTKGFGGAIAAKQTAGGSADVTVEDCIFGGSAGNKAITSASGGASPSFTTGSASGGGDIYQSKGTLTLRFCEISDSVAGIPMTVGGYNDTKQMDEFTGDGGSIAVHGTKSDTTLVVEDCSFSRCKAYGTGGAIYIAKDSTEENRAFFTAWQDGFVGFIQLFNAATWNTTPAVLGGGCNGTVTRIDFVQCEAGFSGGALCACGRDSSVQIDEVDFLECKAGIVHDTDGKGGGIAFGGGHQGTIVAAGSPENHTPRGKITIGGNSTFVRCTSSDNGGGLYVTISGEILMAHTTFDTCEAKGATGVAGHTVSAGEEGLGGGMHVSAGGMMKALAGTVLQYNKARNNGGALGCKNGLLDLLATAGNIIIKQNQVVGATSGGSLVPRSGNGGGIFVSTAAFDGWPLTEVADLLFGPGKIKVEDGQSGSGARRITIINNTAPKWAGGLFIGWPGVHDSECQGEVNCRFEKNFCGEEGANSPYGPWNLWPAEVVMQNQDVSIDMKTSHIEGLSTSIGLYDRESDLAGFNWGTVTFNTGIGRQHEED